MVPLYHAAQRTSDEGNKLEIYQLIADLCPGSECRFSMDRLNMLHMSSSSLLGKTACYGSNSK